MGLLRRKHTPPTPPPVQDRLAEAERALANTEQVKNEATRQVSFFQNLRQGWDRVHERNNLASLFNEEYRRTHGGS